MSYLTAYRSQSAKYGDGQGKAFKLPAPYKPNTRPGHANDNERRPANDNLRTLRRVLPYTARGAKLLRAHPYLRAALTAYDVWKFIHNNDTMGQYGPINQPGFINWILQTSCGGAPATHIYAVALGTGPHGSTVCFVGSLDNGAQTVPINDPLPQGTGKFHTSRLTGYQQPSGYPLHAARDYYYTNLGYYAPAGRRIFRQMPKALPRAVTVAPHLLPIQQVMPYPLPLPMNIVTERVNDPLGSQRTNGDQRPRFVVRGPPPKGTHEKKLRGLGPYVQAVQGLAHATTEALDALDALHKALPKELQAKARFNDGKWWNASPQAKAEALWKGRDRIDWNEAVKNLIMNHVTDQLIGRTAAGVKRSLDSTPIGRIAGGPAVFGGGL